MISLISETERRRWTGDPCMSAKLISQYRLYPGDIPCESPGDGRQIAYEPWREVEAAHRPAEHKGEVLQGARVDSDAERADFGVQRPDPPGNKRGFLARPSNLPIVAHPVDPAAEPPLEDPAAQLVILFVIRVGRPVLRQRWAEPASGRLYAISVPFLVINISLLAYLIALLAAANFDFTAVPLGVVLAMDHAVFIGVIANLNFGMIYDASNARQRASGWLEHVLFWGLNVGLVGFLAGLILESAPLKRVSTPLMGTAILVGIVVYSLRIWGRADAPVQTPAAEPTG